MSVSRFLLLLIVTSLFPITAWGQAVRTPYPNPMRGRVVSPLRGYGDQFAPNLDDANSPSGPLNDSIPGPNGQQQPTGVPQNDFRTRPAPRPQQQSPVWQTSERGGYFGVMGAVAQPGVYLQPQSRVGLKDLIILAGGTTPGASGGVRIVRQGRGGLQTFLSPESQYELLTGDVIFVESHRQTSFVGLRQFAQSKQTSENGLRAGANAPDSNPKKRPPTQAYLAFVNLAPEPIVVPVPDEQATLTAVMAWLRQDLKSPPFVRVIPPSPQLRPDNSVPADQQLLESGSVLVFDPSTVKLDRLPEFPPIKGAGDTPAANAVSAPAVNPVSPAPRVIADPPPELSPVNSPAARAARSLPTPKAPTPSSAVPKAGAIPRRGVGQQSASPSGGPMLLMPPNRRDSNPQVTRPDSKSRPSVQSTELNGDQPEETTAAGYEGRPVSWQTQSASGDENPADPEFEGQGVILAHIEQDLGKPNDQMGPILELPRPAPKLLPEPAMIEAQPKQSEPATMGNSLASTFKLRVVWFSISGSLLLLALLWWLSRLDGPRPVHARVRAERQSVGKSAPFAFRFRRSVMLAEGQPILRADSVSPPISVPPAEVAPEAKQTEEPAAPALPPPIHSISQREHALRAHFRQARLERAQRTTLREPAETESQPEATDVVEPPSPPAPVVMEPHVRVPAPHSGNRPSDVLERALQVKRGTKSVSDGSESS